MEVSRDKLKKVFPHLTEELNASDHKVKIDSIRSDPKTAEKMALAQRNLTNYNPDVIDFIRRCDSREQAKEIISYMENRGEIHRGYAQKLRRQLRSKGVRSFGPKKEGGHYFKVNNR